METDRPRSQSGARAPSSPVNKRLTKHASIEAWLHRQWAKRGLFAWLLSPLSFAFLCVSQSRRRDAKPRRLPVPVVVVGNIYVGGTGKTPVTIDLVRSLASMGWNPGVISRGYGRKTDPVQLVNPDTQADESGDEPLLIARKTHVPVAVGLDRYEAGKLLLESHPGINLIISDDGLQHYGLARDVELCVVGARGLGNEWVLPAGPLREPPSRLDTVDAIILNATEEVLSTRTPRFAATPLFGTCKNLVTHQETTIDELGSRFAPGRISAAAGIAVPKRFFAMIRAHDIVCAHTIELGDHYNYESNPFRDLDADCILITEKDAVKCRQIPEIAADPRIWVVGYEVQVERYLLNLIDKKLKDSLAAAKGKPDEPEAS